MKTLIAYCSHHGCTEKTAVEIKNYLGSEVVLCNLKRDKTPDLDKFDRIIVGGSIHAGRIQNRIQDFCRKNLMMLLEKEVGLYICCMEEGEVAQRELQQSFPEELLMEAKATACFGGEFNFEKMIVKKVAHIEESTSKIDHLMIQNFSERMDRIFNPFLFLA